MRRFYVEATNIGQENYEEEIKMSLIAKTMTEVVHRLKMQFPTWQISIIREVRINEFTILRL